MASSINVHEFLKLSERNSIVDVRTPKEFEQGHIVGAINFPLFTNEERILIGTLYKKEGKQNAVLKGLELIGPRMHSIVKDAESIFTQSNFPENKKERTVLFHCWRGGMRSSSMAWLFELVGYKCYTLSGGYKSYRKYVLASFNEPKNIVVLSGKTGSGKTIILAELQKQGEQIIDLEQLARHKGSSFGALGEKKQLSQEQFENELAFQFTKTETKKRIWVEDESRKIGLNVIPERLWLLMRNAKVYLLDIRIEERINYLVKEYGKFSKQDLQKAIERISKRLGGQNTKQALQAIEINDLKTACEISLHYYDKSYEYGLNLRLHKDLITPLYFKKLDIKEIALKLVEQVE